MKITAETFSPTLSLANRRINVDPESRRIAVRVAGWNDVHSGHAGSVKMPRNVNLDAAYGKRYAILDDGSELPVANLPMGTLHAAGGLSAEEARQVYENTGRQVARVRYSLDDEGIRADGILYDDIDRNDLDRLTASDPSGDWRTMTHIRSMDEFEHAPADFVGTAIVNMPGFSDSFASMPATPLRLVACADSNSMILMENTVEDDTAYINADDDKPGGTLTVDVVVNSITAGADGDSDESKPECESETPCDGCTCGKAKPDAPAYSMTASGDTLEDLQASITEQLTALTASSTYESLNDETYRQLVERVSMLEEIVRDAILSM